MAYAKVATSVSCDIQHALCVFFSIYSSSEVKFTILKL